MNGLGIVLEETTANDQNQTVIDRQTHRKYTNTSEEEALLPPLPNEHDLNESSTNTSVKDDEMDSWNEKASSGSNPSITNMTMANVITNFDDNEPFVSSALMANSTISLPNNNDYFFQNSNNSFSTYELDSPSLNHSNQLFPSISSTNSNSNSNPSKDTKETSPLRRLKSLKSTIRKLSLSKSNSTTNIGSMVPVNSTSTVNSVTSTSQGLGPSLHHTQSYTVHSNSVPISTANSSVGTPTSKVDRPQLSPIQNHFKTFSLDSDGSTTSDKLKCITPTTPPYSSPIITLSDNAGITKENLQKIEHNYFATFMKQQEDGKEIEDQTQLMNYFNYLVNERNLINETYNLTKNRLVKSGWCSTEDLNNLSAQKATQLNQIKLKLEEINGKLSKYND